MILTSFEFSIWHSPDHERLPAVRWTAVFPPSPPRWRWRRISSSAPWRRPPATSRRPGRLRSSSPTARPPGWTAAPARRSGRDTNIRYGRDANRSTSPSGGTAGRVAVSLQSRSAWRWSVGVRPPCWRSAPIFSARLAAPRPVSSSCARRSVPADSSSRWSVSAAGTSSAAWWAISSAPWPISAASRPVAGRPRSALSPRPPRCPLDAGGADAGRPPGNADDTGGAATAATAVRQR